MTDILNGKIDILGFEINPETTQAEFEAVLGGWFDKACLNPEAVTPSIFRFALNGKVGVSPEPFVVDKHTTFVLNDMAFINVLVLFRDGYVSWVRLITDMDDYYIDENGRLKYSDAKNKLRFQTMNAWAIKSFGIPSYQNRNVIRWNCDWGTIQPSSAFDDDGSTLYIEFRRGR